MVGGFAYQLVCPGVGLVMAADDVADWVVCYTFMVGWLQYNIANPPINIVTLYLLHFCTSKAVA